MVGQENTQDRVWAHLGRVGGTQLPEVPDSGSAEAVGALGGGQEGRSLWSTAHYAGAKGLSGGERPVNARGVNSRQKFQTGLEAPPKNTSYPALPQCSPSEAPNPCVRVTDLAPQSPPAVRCHCAGASPP